MDNISPLLIEKAFKWGETVNLEAIINNDEGYTYQFTGWQTTSVQDLGANYNETALSTQIVMPAEATEITAVASKMANTYKVAFNPNLVSEYRLIGYENKSITKEEFEDVNESFMDFLFDLIPVEILKSLSLSNLGLILLLVNNF